MKTEPGSPMTLANAAAACVRLNSRQTAEPIKPAPPVGRSRATDVQFGARLDRIRATSCRRDYRR